MGKGYPETKGRDRYGLRQCRARGKWELFCRGRMKLAECEKSRAGSVRSSRTCAGVPPQRQEPQSPRPSKDENRSRGERCNSAPGRLERSGENFRGHIRDEDDRHEPREDESEHAAEDGLRIPANVE